ncbi:erg24, C-14 sterol reductase, partial [Chytriomyces hyalinus]
MCQSIFHVKAPTQPGSTANPEPEKKPNAQLIKTANPPVFRMLSKLTVTCRNASQGCLWKGSLADDEAHVAACKPECQIQVCKKAVVELEACKIKCAEIESELAACKVACAEMEKRAAESAASERKANLSITKKHAEEVSRLTSQLERKDACLELMQRERIDSAVRERGMADSIDMLTMRLSYLMTREEERSLQFMESMPALFSSDSLTSIVGATAGGYLLAYVRAKGLCDGTVQCSNRIAGNRRVEREIDLDRFPTKSSLLTATHLDFFDQRMESWIAEKMTAWKNNKSQSGMGHLEKDLLPAAAVEVSPAAIQELMKLPTLEIIQQSLHLVGTHPSLLQNAATESANAAKPVLRLRNPVTQHFEFLGPYLTPVVIAALTVLPTTLNGLCGGGDDQQCPPSWVYTMEWGQHTKLVEQIGLQLTEARVLRAVMVVCGWMALHACLYYLVPGRWIKGTQIRDGAVLTYPINAFGALIASYALIAGLSTIYGPALLYWVADNTLPLCVASTLLCLLQSGLLYSYSFRVTTELPDGPLLAEGGNSGYPLYDFFIGRELNPRVGSFDFKYFCELRPGLIGWTVLNAANAVRQGVFVSGLSVETVTWAQVFRGIGMSMWLVLAFQLYYVVDALWNEAAILTTMDITTDGFGFMLNFGDLAWVPFTYSLQSRYLAMHPVQLSPFAVAALIGLKLTGLYIFRGSNGQKNAFRTNPNSPSCTHLKYLETKS